MAYDFSRFSPQSFERLIQALAAASVGGRIQIYGAGKDGAREATFIGKCQLSTESWDGYVVFQAKHRSVGVNEDADADADWLIGQLDRELKKFEDKRRGLRKPDYYVIASNVRLSAAAGDVTGRGMGGIDKVVKHLEVWGARLGFKGTHLWHLDTLSTLLDVHKDVRSVFEFWVQPGDVLAQIMRKLAEPQQVEVLVKYLRNGLRASRDIKTRDIGQAAGRTITLDDVFVDLPFSRRSLAGPNIRFNGQSSWPEFYEDDKLTPDTESEAPDDELAEFEAPKVLAELLTRASDSFHPQTWVEEREQAPDREKHTQTAPFPNRIVLLGGPGQGKSTIGQFMAQFLRARLLKALPFARTPEMTAAITAILHSGTDQRISATGALRYPFHIELPRFANALDDAEGKGNYLSLLSYVSKDISRASESNLSPTELARWLAKLPTCIILDGLDEVPYTSNRAAVITAIEELLDTIHEIDGDCLVFATSRPQGYQEELSPNFWVHWQLTSLQPEDALDVARKAAPILVTDDTRRAEVLTILSEAADEEATACLMISPLQMMMLFHLVSTHNNIPRDRWTLFRRHYEMLCEREIAKSGTLGNMIRDFRPQIDSIHYNAGYLLHLRAEERGSADAFLTQDEFASLVRQQLAQDGYADEENFERLISSIVGLAVNRLVFLRSAVEGNIAFDVRSLQEFMAAARLTSSPEDRIRGRLTKIAGRSHWSHVFKIAYAKVYASTGHEALREPLVALLDSLDAGDRSNDDRVLRTGSRLALDLVIDGIAVSVPVFRRKLVARAAKLVSMPVGVSIWSLQRALDIQYRSVLEPVFKEALGSDTATRLAMLRLLALMNLQDGGATLRWTDELLIDAWPENPSDVLEIFDDAARLPEFDLFASRLRCAQWASVPIDVINWSEGLLNMDPEEPSPPAGLLVCSGPPTRKTVLLRTVTGSRSRVRFTYQGLRNATVVAEVPDGAHPMWFSLQAALEFAKLPSVQSADAFLTTFKTSEQLKAARNMDIPWVLRALLTGVVTLEELEVRRASLQAGEQGNDVVWQAAEDRWDRIGIDQTEIVVPAEWKGMPPDIATYGGPLVNGIRQNSRSDGAEEALIAVMSRYPGDSWITQIFLNYIILNPSSAGQQRRSVLLADSTRIAVVRYPLKARYVQALLGILQQNTVDDEILLRLREALTDPSGSRIASLAHLRTAIKIFGENNDFRTLIPLIASGVISLANPAVRSSVVLPEAALVTDMNDPLSVRTSSAALRVFSGKGEGTYDQKDIDLLARHDKSLATRLMMCLERHRTTMGEYTPAPTALSRAILADRQDSSRLPAYQILLNFDEALTVDLRSVAQTMDLSLPCPLPNIVETSSGIS